MKKHSHQKELFQENCDLIIKEMSNLLNSVDSNEVNKLIDEIIKAEKIFFIGVGRVALSLQCFCKRLMHLGFEANIVGAVNEKAMTHKDLLIIGSGSGESIFPVEIAKKASKLNGKIGLITSAKSSTIKSLSNFSVHLPSPTKNDPDYGVKSKQPMSTLFDQVLHIFGDVVCMMIINKKGLANKDFWLNHANLE